MAKVYESDIDPNEFIRSFRDDSSGISAMRRKSTEEKNSDNTPSEVKAQPTESNVTPPKHASTTTTVPAVPADAESEYRQKYIANTTYLRPKLRFLMVEINPDFIQKIKRIISYENDSPCSIKSFVNNVLAEHFERYESIIKKRL